MNKEELDKLRSYPLGDDDLEKILGKDIFIFTYPYLNEVKSIDDVFDDKGRSMMLFLTEDENTGHWIAMIKKGFKIEYFDPYGGKPDCDMKWLDEETKEELGQEHPILTDLLKDSGYKVDYNLFPFQSKANHINTCGRWSAMRLYYKKLSLKQFYDMIKKGCIHNNMTSDEYICYLSYQLINK